jgi:peptidyl-prolyl cis-trans isomerase C
MLNKGCAGLQRYPLPSATFGCTSKNEVSKSEQKGRSCEVNGTAITAKTIKEVELLPPSEADDQCRRPEGNDRPMVVRRLVMQEESRHRQESGSRDQLEDLKKGSLSKLTGSRVEEQAKITDADLQKFYDQNKEKFKTSDQIKASHILLKTEKEAQDVLAQLKAGGKFEDLARKYSVDPAGAKGGDLGWFGKGSMIPEFEKVAFALKEGETSGIVKTKFGYHIIKVTGKRAAGVLPLAEVKDQIKAALLPERQQEIFKKMREDLKKNAKYTIKEDVLKSLDTKPAGGEKALPAETKKN